MFVNAWHSLFHSLVPPRSLVMGRPAKVTRQLTDEEVAGLEFYWKNYVEYASRYRNER